MEPEVIKEAVKEVVQEVKQIQQVPVPGEIPRLRTEVDLSKWVPKTKIGKASSLYKTKSQQEKFTPVSIFPTISSTFDNFSQF